MAADKGSFKIIADRDRGYRFNVLDGNLGTGMRYNGEIYIRGKQCIGYRRLMDGGDEKDTNARVEGTIYCQGTVRK